MNTTITGSVLKEIGFPSNEAFGKALKVLRKQAPAKPLDELLNDVKQLLTAPAQYTQDAVWSEVAAALISIEANRSRVIPLKTDAGSFAVYGETHIEKGAFDQMETAMHLPVTAFGALMPDAHQGYGLPIGGVLATRDAIIPYGVGVDIGCRMCLSIYDIPGDFYFGNESKLKRELIAHSKFGAGAGWTASLKATHAVLERDEFNQIPLLKSLIDKAHSQLGTSGGGNHFVEFGLLEVLQEDESVGIPKGTYLALLTHSGSRGFGATIAGHYTKVAKETCVLPDVARNLAYLDMQSDNGKEYWAAMNLAGDYASACHEVIHDRITKAIGATCLKRVENHHNFAWKEVHFGEEFIVHRKGATPAAEGVLGIIPGSMTAPGYLVKGKGKPDSLASASHGAGRQMSRTQAIKTVSHEALRETLKSHGVTLIGAGLDEAPMAYKNIEDVMRSQQDLVEVLARFTPKMVRMADDGSRED